MTPAPIPHDESRRLESLTKLNLLDTPLEERFERITRLACRLLGGLLDALVQIGVDDGTWEALSRNLYLLRLNGTPIPFPHALIATIAIRESLDLWTFDNHFKLIQPALPQLVLFSAPVFP
jgi:hypothetical protein